MTCWTGREHVGVSAVRYCLEDEIFLVHAARCLLCVNMRLYCPRGHFGLSSVFLLCSVAFDCVWLLGLLLIMSLVPLSRLVRRARSLA